MQQMLAGIAHEVRNPLAGMTLFAGLLRDELPDGDDRRAHVLRIERELGYLDRVVTEFLDYARRPAPELADVPVAALLAEIADVTSTEATRVVAVSPDATLVVRADRSQLRRALINLAHNAVHASAPGAEVVLSARAAGAEVQLAVANRGAEIPADVRGKLFEPFFTTREKGTGLGLSFVREIARDHGGGVDVACAGGTTTFTLRIPRAG
jgi:signal transduction histidine kinase